MEIKADQEWIQTIHKLLDLSLRANWIQALDEINYILKSMETLKPNQKEDGTKKEM